MLNLLGSKGGTECTNLPARATARQGKRGGRGGKEKRGRSSALHITPHSVNSSALPFSPWPSTTSATVYPSPAPTEQRASPSLLPVQKETLHCSLGHSEHNTPGSAPHPCCTQTTTTCPGRCKFTLNSNLKGRPLDHKREM